jgi:hypothetical protein
MWVRLRVRVWACASMRVRVRVRVRGGASRPSRCVHIMPAHGGRPSTLAVSDVPGVHYLCALVHLLRFRSRVGLLFCAPSSATRGGTRRCTRQLRRANRGLFTSCSWRARIPMRRTPPGTLRRTWPVLCHPPSAPPTHPLRTTSAPPPHHLRTPSAPPPHPLRTPLRTPAPSPPAPFPGVSACAWASLCWPFFALLQKGFDGASRVAPHAYPCSFLTAVLCTTACVFSWCVGGRCIPVHQAANQECYALLRGSSDVIHEADRLRHTSLLVDKLHRAATGPLH